MFSKLTSLWSPQDAVVYFAQGDAMTDPEFWDEPEKFKPERFFDPETKVPIMLFGLGERYFGDLTGYWKGHQTE